MAGAGGNLPALETNSISADASQDQMPLLQSPQVPLCQRLPEYTAQLASLLSWHEQALEAVRAVGDTWAREEGGPSQADLEVCHTSDYCCSCCFLSATQSDVGGI